MARRAKTLDDNIAYQAGDQIHITVTQDFTETATEFFRFCKKYHYSPSEVIRGCMASWLDRTKKMVEMWEKSDQNREEILNEIINQYPWLKQALKIPKSKVSTKKK